ncbi:hypothetical protein LM600983_60026 [Listeria monocytogenes]|nr:hypothetical protein LM600983_60026 [Listeria monocytogenes]CUL29434.1 hypothetical protein LM7416_50030 [Listeria monocytogenes]CUL29478.1 hypothetical protein LM7414_50030 [Listeria monocytogenes]CUL37292.1 hypothetical protein LM7420_50029 [Listeria monocytogenes]CUL45971.1 hypothetical protein LM7423_40029 [Listeria monocytogenes]
MIEGELSNLTS